MSKRKLKAKAPEYHVWCRDQWKHTAACMTCRKLKKCIIVKAYQEEQDSGKDLPKGKDNKGKRRKGKR
jgi:hypothetical protein